MQPFRRKFCIRKRCCQSLQFILIGGFAAMLAFGIIDMKYANDYPYIKSDELNALKDSNNVCLSFPQCTSNCTIWNTTFQTNNQTEYILQSRCALMCSIGNMLICQVCQNTCVEKWNNYYSILPKVGSGTNYERGKTFVALSVPGLLVAIVLFNTCRERCCPTWGFSRSEIPPEITGTYELREIGF